MERSQTGGPRKKIKTVHAAGDEEQGGTSAGGGHVMVVNVMVLYEDWRVCAREVVRVAAGPETKIGVIRELVPVVEGERSEERFVFYFPEGWDGDIARLGHGDPFPRGGRNNEVPMSAADTWALMRAGASEKPVSTLNDRRIDGDLWVILCTGLASPAAAAARTVIADPVAQMPDLVHAEAAFSCAVSDPFNSLVAFARHLLQCFAEYSAHSGSYLSPYTSLVQSSGYGKTRLCRRLALEWDAVLRTLRECQTTTSVRIDPSMRVIYLCLRPEKAVSPLSGYPPRSPLADVLLPSASSMSRDAAELYVAHALLCILEEDAGEPAGVPDWYFDTSGNKEAMTMASARVGRWLKDEVPTWATVQSRAAALRGGNGRVEGHAALKYVIVFDEARELLKTIQCSPDVDAFRVVRSSLRRLWECGLKSMMAVFTDTLGSVMNFAPPAMFVPSGRSTAGRTPKELLPPFYNLRTLNAVSSLSIRDDDAGAVLDLCTIGRPLWATWANAVRDEVTAAALRSGEAIDPRYLDTIVLKRVQNLANAKLGGARARKDQQADALAHLAWWACRIALRVDPFSESLTSQLAGSYMGTLVKVSEDRHALTVVYPHEPMLTLAAEELIKDYTAESLASLATMHSTRAIAKGGKGELAAQVICILAMDSVRPTGVAPIPALSFAREMASVPEDCAAVLEGWTVNFIRFIEVPRLRGMADVRHMWTMRAAVQLPDNWRGADLLIPVKKGEEFSYVLVQVKNRTRASGEAVAKKLAPEYVFEGLEELSAVWPVMAIVMDVGVRQPREARVALVRGRSDDSRGGAGPVVHLHLYGPRAAFLEEEHSNVLATLCDDPGQRTVEGKVTDVETVSGYLDVFDQEVWEQGVLRRTEDMQ